MRDYRQIDVRAVRGVVVDAHVRDGGGGGSHLRFAGLQVARKMWKEGGGNLNADFVASAKHIASEHAIEIEFANLAGLEQLRLQLFVAVARAQHIEARAH